jgi:hypothetical protein
MKRSLPSPAQVKHRHNFIVHGAVASMCVRVRQLINDDSITSTRLKVNLLTAEEALCKALQFIQTGGLRKE